MAALADIYPRFINAIAYLFQRIDANTTAISQLNLRAPYGETRRLLDAELVARNLLNYNAACPPLRDNLKLPYWDQSRAIAYPPSPSIWNERALLAAEAMRKRMAEKFALTNGPDWYAAQDMRIAEQQAEHAKREEELKQAEAESKAEYERRLQESERRR